jgi:crotonobetaine/carnitine-CoA ligase
VETGLPITQGLDQPRVKGSCGTAAREYAIEIHDDAGVEVPAGSIGEIVVRPLKPAIVFDGYFGMSEATVETFRGLWLHTGDTGYADADGNYFFVGRASDAIRRRGENVSPLEVEEGVMLHPDVLECAAIGVPSELSEEDIKVCVIRRPGASLSPSELLAHCETALGRFQVPRYIEFVSSLPKTPTGKVERYRLKETPPGAACWDREEHLDRDDSGRPASSHDGIDEVGPT